MDARLPNATCMSKYFAWIAPICELLKAQHHMALKRLLLYSAAEMPFAESLKPLIHARSLFGSTALEEGELKDAICTCTDALFKPEDSKIAPQKAK